MSDFHASRSFRRNAPKGTRHNGPHKVPGAGRSDPNVYARLAADLEGKPKATPGKKALRHFKLAKKKEKRNGQGTN